MRILALPTDTEQGPQRPQAPRPSPRLFHPRRRILLDFAIDALALELLALERAEACRLAPAGAPCFCFQPLGAP